MPAEPTSFDIELRNLWSARATAQQQIAAAEESFRIMPTHQKARRLADKRHELHLIELDIVEMDDKRVEMQLQDDAIRKALRTLPRV